MAREKIIIKKIENIAARQVTFSKRRRGLFKKAEELAVLCDIDVALIIFSATGKLYEYSSSSMNKILEKYQLHLSKLEKTKQPSLELQLQNIYQACHVNSNEEVADMIHQLRQMKVEDLQGLNIEELQQLEKVLAAGLSNVIQTKVERIMKEFSTLEKKGAELVQEHNQLKQKMAMIYDGKMHMVLDSYNKLVIEEGQSSESNTNACSCNVGPPPQADCSDTSLKLGQPFN